MQKFYSAHMQLTLQHRFVWYWKRETFNFVEDKSFWINAFNIHPEITDCNRPASHLWTVSSIVEKNSTASFQSKANNFHLSKWIQVGMKGIPNLRQGWNIPYIVGKIFSNTIQHSFTQLKINNNVRNVVFPYATSLHKINVNGKQTSSSLLHKDIFWHGSWCSLWIKLKHWFSLFLLQNHDTQSSREMWLSFILHRSKSFFFHLQMSLFSATICGHQKYRIK